MLRTNHILDHRNVRLVSGEMSEKRVLKRLKQVNENITYLKDILPKIIYRKKKKQTYLFTRALKL